MNRRATLEAERESVPTVRSEGPRRRPARSQRVCTLGVSMFGSRKSVLRAGPLIVAAVTAAFGLVAAPLASAQGTMKAIDLGTLGGSGGLSAATAINDHGDIVGYTSTLSGARHAFVWHKGKMSDLGTLGGRNSEATDINARGDIVGYSDTPSGALCAFVWQRGHLTALRGPNGAPSWAAAINNRGEVVGASSYGSYWHAVRWSNGKVSVLASHGAPGSWAYAINNHGQIAGEVSPDGMNAQPTLWTGRATVVATKRGTTRGINDRGQITGHDYGNISFLWYRGTFTTLRIPGAEGPEAWAINERGQIVGQSGFFSWVWYRGNITRLPSLVPRAWTVGHDINNHGQIAGSAATISGGYGEHAVLWITT
jgi:probable HAF family extracellular repeat protein